MDKPGSGGGGGADVVAALLGEVDETVVEDMVVLDVIGDISVALKFICMRGAHRLNVEKLVVERFSVV